MYDHLDAHYRAVIRQLTQGAVVPFFGAGVNLCGRPDIKWEVGRFDHLPSGNELAEYLAELYGYQMDDTNPHCSTCRLFVNPNINCHECDSPVFTKVRDLARVSQHVDLLGGPRTLYNELHTVFDGDYKPTPLHRLFAKLPGLMRAKGYTFPLLIVTTNYDDLMERAFLEIDEGFDIVSHVVQGEFRGKFLHWPASGGNPIPIERPNEYTGALLTSRPVVLKIHGTVNRSSDDALKDNYVITEDHYIDYLTRTDITSLLPVKITAKLRNCSFLFLGYGLRDWNLRVFLHRISAEHELKYQSWAIQLNPLELDRKFWEKRGISIYDARLEDYIEELTRRVEAMPPREVNT